MRDLKITCDYCGKIIPENNEWHFLMPISTKVEFFQERHLDCCSDCMSELEAKREAREGH